MNFTTAKTYVMPFGKHEGKTIDQIATKDSGLLYLDWLRGQREAERKRTKTRTSADAQLDEALTAYLDDQTIARDLRTLLHNERAYGPRG